MALFDLVVAGGTLMTAGGAVEAGIGIHEGRIAAWLSPGLEVDARERIDATGRFILPGVVDAHVHFRDPGLVHKEDFQTGSAAAAAGGVTTVMVMPTDDPLTLTPDDFEAKRRLAEGRIHVDVALQAALVADTDHVAALADLGAVSFEAFLGDIPSSLLMPDMGRFQAALEAVATAGSVLGVSAADDGVIALALAGVRKDPQAGGLGFFRSRPPLSETVGVAKACAVARQVGGRMHFRQMSCAESTLLLEQARACVPGLSAEVTPHNLLLTQDEIVRQGPFAKVLPPLRQPDDLAALWRALKRGVIDIVATDHAPHAPEEKKAGLDDIWQAPGGFPGVQTLLPLLLDAVAAHHISWADLVRIACEMPARLFGLYPRKGHLAPGADADLVIVDPARAMTIRNEDQLSKAGITPFAGRAVRGTPVLSLLRGRVLMRDGRIAGSPRGEVVGPSRGAARQGASAIADLRPAVDNL
ncbi:dihydroorotase family protein [Bosea sp. (in: a-proteobacteria)]|uniref:dihydroorotase n=1 Tax=Bosea sp. (in: a-proteobacteria) TaxID=1871050 RepID=UPI00261F163A|nr:dihydroorotase family protein [Bosea sp. (in: a-proteobacteria)]MCO5092149.1 dihydroorotase family protein [Bosea sp. (in: a-proteobacteria)]